MKIITFILVVLFSSVTVFASGVFTLSKSQQIRLNTIIKQLKIPSGDYKLTVTNTGVTLRAYEPTIDTVTGETLIQEKIVEKIVIVEKPVIVEKIVEKPMSLCVDLSKVNYPSGRVGEDTQLLIIEIEKMRTRNQILGCP